MIMDCWYNGGVTAAFARLQRSEQKDRACGQARAPAPTHQWRFTQTRALKPSERAGMPAPYFRAASVTNRRP